MKYDDFIIGQYYCFTKERNDNVIINSESDERWNKNLVNNPKGLKLLNKLEKNDKNSFIYLEFETIDGGCWAYMKNDFQQTNIKKNLDAW